MGSGVGPTITTVAEADLTAFGSDGFTLDWTTADATAREFFYLALGDAGTAPTEPPPLWDGKAAARIADALT